MKLTQEQLNILENWEIEWNKFYLQWQLDRKQYVDINKVLETIWLKWNRKEKAHIIRWFTEEELKDSIQEIIEIWEVETLEEIKKRFQFYQTPEEIAKYLVKLADIQPSDYILEPSAGQWAIAKYFPKENDISLVEFNKDNYKVLKENIDFTDDINNEDFLEYKSTSFDKIIANPPFSKSQDVKHILHMYDLLKIWWRIVSIASNSIQTRYWKSYNMLMELNPKFIDLPEWSFKESWTLVNTVIVIIDK